MKRSVCVLAICFCLSATTLASSGAGIYGGFWQLAGEVLIMLFPASDQKSPTLNERNAGGADDPLPCWVTKTCSDSGSGGGAGG